MKDIILKTEEEIGYLRQANQLIGKTLGLVSEHIKPGVKTIDLDTMAEEFIRDNGGLPGFKGLYDFPNTLCMSINEEIVHGTPGDRELKEGEIVSVDCGVLIEGFNGDSAYTFGVGEISDDLKRLLKVTKESLYKGIEHAVVNQRLGDIGYHINNHVRTHGYSIVQGLCGHGVGKTLHEGPSVLNHGRRGSGIKLKEGMTIAIEPMVSMGDNRPEHDGFTLKTVDNSPAAHFEHSVAIRHGEAEILSTFEYIDEIHQY